MNKDPENCGTIVDESTPEKKYRDDMCWKASRIPSGKGRFVDVYYTLFCGHAIKREGWFGYWKLNAKNQIEMHCKDGRVIVGCEDLNFTLLNCCAEDWQVIDDVDVAKWDAIHAAVRAGTLVLPGHEKPKA